LDGGVVCNGNCEYGSLCLAAAAGISESFCEKPEACPENVLFPCSGSFDMPVICSSGCQYDNICMAVGAGGSGCEVVSEEVCPIPAVACINRADPVICAPDGCEYGNLCLAVGAGFKEGVCVSNCPIGNFACGDPVLDPVLCAGCACPIGNRGNFACGPAFNPVLCAGCAYDNLCSAQNGPGFTEADCESIPSECPETDPDRFSDCALGNLPVICIRNGVACEFDNLCLALEQELSDCFSYQN
jgi:hypothetical protein